MQGAVMTQPQGDAGQSDDGQQQGDNAGAGGGFKPIESQEALDRIVGERATRAKAAGRAEAEAEFQALINDSRDDGQKMADRIAELEKAHNEATVKSLRLTAANSHGITDAEDIRLFLTGTDEQTLTAQAKRLADRDADRKKNGNRVPREGESPHPTNDPNRNFLRQLTGQD